MLSLIQDLGRFGQAQLGLSCGGPADNHAFAWANRLLANDVNSAVIEISLGGLELVCLRDTQICITGAHLSVKINQQSIAQWRVNCVKEGDTITLGMANKGTRIYLAVNGGFAVPQQFNSAATVVREGIGGFDGRPLSVGQTLTAYSSDTQPLLGLAAADIPNYPNQLCLNVIKSYQHDQFHTSERERFFLSEYQVSHLADRMGYRLSGAAIQYPTRTLYSEGICEGAIQIPADGQPIIIGKDRQTIGGYPKIGTLLSTDLSRLMQAGTGDRIRFRAINIEDAHNSLHLSRIKYANTQPLKL
jgi:biotin-dependent carboxylase-like uncharacterized protein